MKHLAIMFIAAASLAGTAMACPNSENHGKTAETSEAAKQTAQKTTAPAAKDAPATPVAKDAKDAPAAKETPAKPAPAKSDKVSSK